MDGLTSEMAVKAVGSRYDLVLIAARLCRELNEGWKPLVDSYHSSPVTALHEIETGKIGRDYLNKPANIDRKRDRPTQDSDK